MLYITSLVILALIRQTYGYAVVVDPSCTGISICRSIQSDNDEFAVLDENGTVLECLFGQTAVENDVDSNNFCDTPCEGEAFFDCVCVSDSNRASGLALESTFDAILGTVFIITNFLVIGVHVFFCFRYSKKETLYQARKEEAGGDLKKLDLLPPNPPRHCCYGCAYLVLFILWVVFFVRVAQTRGQDYWTGCGNDEFGFFRDELNDVPDEE